VSAHLWSACLVFVMGVHGANHIPPGGIWRG
jgi:hypothetical protein